MFKRLLVAVDLSPMSEQVFNVALSLAKLLQGELMVLHALTSDESGSPELIDFVGLAYSQVASDVFFESYRQQWADFEQKGLLSLQQWVERAQSHGIATEMTQSHSKPGPAICSMGKNWGADLIIVGRRGLTGLAGIFASSVSDFVLHHAPCSVLVVHRETQLEWASLATESLQGDPADPDLMTLKL